MSLRINTNVAALNSYNNLNANQAKLESAFQQLSSGLRINKAADDAAGLSIAQGLTSQINGLTQAVSNANDGINVAQIADGALGTTQDILQRMRGLVVKAGNVGTQDSKSLGAIQQEIQNLNTQLDNISKQTKFGQTNLLNGDYNKNFQVGANGGDTITLDLSKASVSSSNIANTNVNLNNLNIATSITPKFAPGETSTTSGTGSTGAGHAVDDNVAVMLGQTDGTDIAFGPADSNGVQKVIVDGDATATTLGTVSFDNKTGVYTVMDAQGTVVGAIDTANYDDPLAKADLSAVSYVAGGLPTGGDDPLYDFLTSTTGANVTAPAAAGIDDITFVADGNNWKVMGGATQLGYLTVSDGVYGWANGTLATASSPSTAWLNTNEPNTSGGIQSYSSDNATADLDKLDTAIGGISTARSQIGAVQNQLGYTVSNLQTAITNVTASRSNLTDADLAQQVTAMTQSQILTQAATSVLAQANSAPQAILKLLQ